MDVHIYDVYERGGCYISHVSGQQAATFCPSLQTLLLSCVNDDPRSSSIGFRAPLFPAQADAYWLEVSSKLVSQDTGGTPTLHLFVLYDKGQGNGGDVLATVQLLLIPKETHQHRAEVAKLLVRPDLRRRGLASVLMDFVEGFAQHQLGKEILTLSTATDTPARAFYKRTGWIEWGICPKYAQYADGKRGDVSFFMKELKSHPDDQEEHL